MQITLAAASILNSFEICPILHEMPLHVPYFTKCHHICPILHEMPPHMSHTSRNATTYESISQFHSFVCHSLWGRNI